MGSSAKQLKWINEQRKFIKNKWGIESTIKINGHITVTFFNSIGKTWNCHFASSPSDNRSIRNQISIMKCGLRENFNIDSNSSDFTMQMYRGSMFK